MSGERQDHLADFRRDVREFIKQHLPPETRRKMLARGHLPKEDIVAWQRILNSKGWATPSWPREWGGPGWSAAERQVFYEEIHLAPAPEPLSFNVGMIGPVLIAFGSEEQKRRFLPRIANLDDWWCQGFSEPNAGSDLASLRTSARRADNGYMVNGQKIWTTQAHWADWMFCLVRTDPQQQKQRGISLLLIDMKSPGVSVQPIIGIDGHHEFNEVFLTDVEVPLTNLVGEENKGWTYAKYLLVHERMGIARIGISKERMARAKFLAARVTSGEATLAQDRSLRERIAEISIEIKGVEMLQKSIISASAAAPAGYVDPRIPMLKIRGSELQQATSELLLRIAGTDGLRAKSEGHEPPLNENWQTSAASTYLFWRAFSIFGGSNEIQKNIVAKSLGL